MRGILAATLFLVSGALAMSDDKKERPFEPLKKEPDFKLDEKVTIRFSNDGGKTFPTTKEGVAANRYKGDKDQKSFYLDIKTGGIVKPHPGSEIVDDAGFVYVVAEDAKTIGGMFLVRVKKKP